MNKFEQKAGSLKYVPRAYSVAFFDNEIALFEVKGYQRLLRARFTSGQDLANWLKESYEEQFAIIEAEQRYQETQQVKLSSIDFTL